MTTKENPENQTSADPTLEFMRHLWQLNHVLERASKSMQTSSGITIQQRMILRYIGKYPGITPGQLADLFHLDAGTISSTITRLRKKGLVERKLSPRDKRRVMIGLTATGRRMDHDASNIVEKTVHQLIQGSTKQAHEHTVSLISALSDLLAQGFAIKKKKPKDPLHNVHPKYSIMVRQ